MIKHKQKNSTRNNNCVGYHHELCLPAGYSDGGKCLPTRGAVGGQNNVVSGEQNYCCETTWAWDPIWTLYGREYSCMWGSSDVVPEQPGDELTFSTTLNCYTGKPSCQNYGMIEDLCFSVFGTNETETGINTDWGTSASGCQDYTEGDGNETGMCPTSLKSCTDQTNRDQCQNCNLPDCQPVNVPTANEEHPENQDFYDHHYANSGRYAGTSYGWTNCTWIDTTAGWCTNVEPDDLVEVSCYAPRCNAINGYGIGDPDTTDPPTTAGGAECCVEGAPLTGGSGCVWAGDCPVMRGDLSGDGFLNVLDIVILFTCILAGNCDDLEFACAGDVNKDEIYNVLDIVVLANCILDPDCLPNSKSLPEGMSEEEHIRIIQDILSAGEDIYKIKNILISNKLDVDPVKSVDTGKMKWMEEIISISNKKNISSDLTIIDPSVRSTTSCSECIDDIVLGTATCCEGVCECVDGYVVNCNPEHGNATMHCCPATNPTAVLLPLVVTLFKA